MKHFILFCLIISFSACSIFQGMPWSDDTAPEEFLSDDENTETSNLDSEEAITKPEELSMADEEDIEYIDPEDEDLLDADVVVEDEGLTLEDDSLEDDSSNLLAMDGSKSSNNQGLETKKEDDFFSAPPTEPSVDKTLDKKKKWISLKKIKDQTYQVAEYLVNAVYIARAGDTVESVSQKIFNSDEQNQLHTINPYLKHRTSGLKVGDKIYYQSPNRGQDSSRVMFYFEDIGVSPKYYRVEVGDNIRKIATDLLGSIGGSWKEIWSTNPGLKSKTIVNEAIEIKYWTTPKQAPSDFPAVEDNTPSPPMDDKAMDDETTSEPDSLPPQPPEEPTEDFQADTSPPEEKKFNLSIENIFLIALAAFSLIFAFVLFKRRKKRAEYDFIAANFEMDNEEDNK